MRLVRAQVSRLRMIFHELTTNAFKYGALSQPEGVTHVSWGKRVDGEGSSVKFCWREEGGPTATPPTRRGFGVAMIERVAKNNRWVTETRFDPKGLGVELVFPVATPES